MRPIPRSLAQQMEADPYYKKCVRNSEGNCAGRITWEHAFIYAGRQINEIWAIIPLCAFHHGVDFYQDCGDLKKDLNEYIALSRATPEDLAKYPRTNWAQKLRYLSEKYLHYGKR